jgi:hypothetical protein
MRMRTGRRVFLHVPGSSTGRLSILRFRMRGANGSLWRAERLPDLYGHQSIQAHLGSHASAGDLCSVRRRANRSGDARARSDILLRTVAGKREGSGQHLVTHMLEGCRRSLNDPHARREGAITSGAGQYPLLANASAPWKPLVSGFAFSVEITVAARACDRTKTSSPVPRSTRL